MTEEDYFQELPAITFYDAELLCAIGALMLTASVAEHAISFQVMRLLTGHQNTEPNAKQMLPLEGMELRVKLQLIKTLSAIEIPEHQKNIVQLCKKIEKAYKKRNLFAHGMINDRVEGDRLAIYFAKHQESGTRPQPETLNAEQIRAYAQRIMHRVVRLEEYLTLAGIRDV